MDIGTCELCGSPRPAGRTFCSLRCANRANSRKRWAGHRGTSVCMSCGRVTEDSLSRSQRRHFCSAACRANYPAYKVSALANLGPPKRGADHWRWRGGPAYGPDWGIQSQAALQRDDHACRACGNRTGKLDVHHIFPWRLRPEHVLDGLLTLCELSLASGTAPRADDSLANGGVSSGERQWNQRCGRVIRPW